MSRAGARTRARRRARLVRRVAAAMVILGLVAACSASRDVSLTPTTTPTTSPSSAVSTTSTTEAPAPVAGADGVGDPYFPGLGNGGYDVAHYDLAIDWSADAGTIDAHAEIDLTPTEALTSFNLDLVGLDVAAITVDGVTAGFTRAGRELTVTPVRPLRSGADVVVVVDYSGSPQPVVVGTDLFPLGWTTHGRDVFVASEPAGAATWFPANDHPTDKATFRFEITVPSDLSVIANGVERSERTVGGRSTWVYEMDDPMATYLASVVIGHLSFDESVGPTGLPIRNAYATDLADAVRGDFARTGEMVATFERWFGPYPFDVYGQVVVDEDLGYTLENQTLSLFGSDLVTHPDGADVVVAHELAHQWFGDAVSVATWRDIWLSEGFATYAEWIWRQESGGPTIAASAAMAYRGADFGVPPGDPGSAELFQPTVYQRGGLALYALSQALGDQAFRQLLRTWVERHEGGTASTADLQALAEELAGRDLSDLFAAWVYGDALPPFP